MKVTEETVREVARLAGLELTADEVVPLARELTRILDYVERISEVPADGVEPRANPWIAAAPLRGDEPHPWPDPGRIVAAAPDHDGPYFRVPLVVDKR